MADNSNTPPPAIAPVPNSPLDGPHASAWAWALWKIRSKNRAAQLFGGGKRIPLVSPPDVPGEGG